jgi:hypothetical protein
MHLPFVRDRAADLRPALLCEEPYGLKLAA